MADFFFTGDLLSSRYLPYPPPESLPPTSHAYIHPYIVYPPSTPPTARYIATHIEEHTADNSQLLQSRTFSTSLFDLRRISWKCHFLELNLLTPRKEARNTRPSTRQ
jgi:hypothetical protein